MRRSQTVQTAASSNAAGARYGMFVAPRRGMETLVHAIRSRLPPLTVQLGQRVDRIAKRADGKWLLTIGPTQAEFNSVIIATPGPQSSKLLRDVDRDLGDLLGRIPCAGVAIAVVAYPRQAIAHRLDGFGVVVPLAERRRIVAASFSHVKFPGRAPEGSTLLRVFVGGACQPELLELEDERIRQLVSEELAELLGAGGQPLFFDVTRWPQAMPQYHVGHLELVERIETRLQMIPNLALAGNALRGVGVPQCIASGERAAEQIITARKE